MFLGRTAFEANTLIKWTACNLFMFTSVVLVIDW